MINTGLPTEDLLIAGERQEPASGRYFLSYDPMTRALAEFVNPFETPSTGNH